MRVRIGDGWTLAERAVLKLLVGLVPLILELRVDVARLGRRDHQPRLVTHEIEPCRIGASGALENEQADEDAEVRPVPEARRQFRVARHLTER
eukprot:7387991-Prymnesium_polylepis.1